MVIVNFSSQNVLRPATAAASIAFFSVVDGIAVAQRLADRGLRLNHP